MNKLAVVLFNLGGPDSLRAVRPFLYNLFNDKAIIPLPQPIRAGLAALIATLRRRPASRSYQEMGGASPILPETEAQARTLEQTLSRPHRRARCFIAMRHWRPFIADAVRDIASFAPDETILLPLYPQFSTTTTGSSLAEWRRAGGGAAKTVCCYPSSEKLCAAHAKLIIRTWEEAGRPTPLRVLFSAHGLPESVIRKGDPYQWQVEQTAARVRAKLAMPDWEYEVCYQSRVGPARWIGPSTEDRIRAAATDDGCAVLICPIAFVSEHVETLVELDMEYADIARQAGMTYLRSPTPRTHPDFIAALAESVEEALTGKPHRFCPRGLSACPVAPGVADNA